MNIQLGSGVNYTIQKPSSFVGAVLGSRRRSHRRRQGHEAARRALARRKRQLLMTLPASARGRRCTSGRTSASSCRVSRRSGRRGRTLDRGRRSLAPPHRAVSASSPSPARRARPCRHGRCASRTHCYRNHAVKVRLSPVAAVAGAALLGVPIAAALTPSPRISAQASVVSAPFPTPAAPTPSGPWFSGAARRRCRLQPPA